MTDEQQNVFTRMYDLADKLITLAGAGKYGGAPQAARQKLDEWKKAVDRVSITATPAYHGADVDPLHKMTAERIRNGLRAEYEARGYEERHAALMKVADDLERASADLPAIAAEVFMEAKRRADDLRCEAEEGLKEREVKPDGAE